MKQKHLDIRIEQCLALSKASNCPRRKFGALLLDPIRNVVLMDGYNGAPRGGGELCGGHFCERDGLKREDFELKDGCEPWMPRGGSRPTLDVYVKGHKVHHFVKHPIPSGRSPEKLANEWIDEMIEKYPSIKSGTHMEKGCHHAEMNVICNSAASGVKTDGAWIIVTGEPCILCSKLIHHAGIAKVIVVDGGYVGENGLEYLNKNGIAVEKVIGPVDPRTTV